MNEPHLLPSWFRCRLASRMAQPARRSRLPLNRSACLYKVDRLGDFVLALGALHQLVAHYGEDDCRLVVSTVAEPLAAAEFPRVARWVLPPTAEGVWREIRPLRNRHAPVWATEHFDALVCLRPASSLYRDISLCWVKADNFFGLGARPSAATLALHNRPLLPAKTAASAPWCHELLAHREVLTTVLGREPAWPEIRPRLRSVVPQSGEEIVFCPFGSETIRDYPVASWREAWQNVRLIKPRVRLLGPSARHAELSTLADILRQILPGSTVWLQTDLPGLAFVQAIAYARAVVTVDSYAAHLATAFDKPAVIVVGGGHFGWFVPWGERIRQRWLMHPLDCFGCNWQCRYSSVRCLAELPPALVSEALTALLPHD